jgi:hypothetical protein
MNGVLDRTFRVRHPRGDLARAVALRDEPEDGQLALGQAAEGQPGRAGGAALPVADLVE